MDRKYDVLVVTLLVIIALGQLSLDVMFVSLHYGKEIGEWARNLNSVTHGNLSVGSIIFYILAFLFVLDIVKILRDRRKRISDKYYAP
jgi:hypothetical protein